MGIQAASMMPKATRYSRGCGTSTRSTVARCSCTPAETAWHIDKPEGQRKETRQWRMMTGKPWRCSFPALSTRTKSEPDRAYSTIRVIASEAGDFVDRSESAPASARPTAGANGVLDTFQDLPESSANKSSIDRVGRTNGGITTRGAFRCVGRAGRHCGIPGHRSRSGSP